MSFRSNHFVIRWRQVAELRRADIENAVIGLRKVRRVLVDGAAESSLRRNRRPIRSLRPGS